VFAIALTLLVLELQLPELESPVSRDAFAGAVRAEIPTFVAWLISFAVLARLWIVHHQLLVAEHGYRRSTVVLNFAFLGVVSFIPFPTSLISRHQDQPLALVVFFVAYLMGAIALAAMWWTMRDEVASHELQEEKDAAARWVIVWIPTASVIACLLAFVDPRLGLLTWIAILLLGMVAKRRGSSSGENEGFA
jgi:uncharacterized membrane protein